MPWSRVNEKILNDKLHNFSILKPNHSIDDSFAEGLVNFLSCLSGLRKLNLSDINLGDEFAIKFSNVLSKKELLPNL
jgi:hypothetical protein